VLAPFAELAVVLALSNVPVVIAEALIADKAEPLAVITLALNEPLESRATMVDAPLELFADV
jgi:hypothetical protein